MAKGIKGDKINKIKRVNKNTIHVIFKNGAILEFKASMVDYEDCELISYVVER